MSAEIYNYDEPVGLYGFQDSKQLAQLAINEVIRYEHGLAAIDSLTATDLRGNLSLTGEPRLGTLVASNERLAYALALADTQQTNRQGTDGIFYTLDLGRGRSLDDEPEVISPKSIFITRSDLIRSRHDYDTEIADLTGRFNKFELEAILRIAGKLATGLEMTAQLARQALSSTYSYRASLNRAVTVEPRVLFALQQYHLGELGTLFPGRPAEAPAADEPSGEMTHIQEWNEFLEAAHNLFQRESDNISANATIALQHEIGTNHYLIKIEAVRGEISKIKVMCYDSAGATHKQRFDLQAGSDEDNSNDLLVSPSWSRTELFKCLLEGTPISEETYKSYLELEALEKADKPPIDAQVIDINSRKRPAA